jgi:Protein of unknown function (DUF3619)
MKTLNEPSVNAHHGNETFVLSIKQALNHSANHVPLSVLEQLSKARENAKLVQKKPTKCSFLQHDVSTHQAKLLTVIHRIPLSLIVSLIIPAIVLGVSLYTLSDDNAVNYIETLAEIDSQVLSQDLPINALLDKGFVQYVQLKK